MLNKIKNGFKKFEEKMTLVALMVLSPIMNKSAADEESEVAGSTKSLAVRAILIVIGVALVSALIAFFIFAKDKLLGALDTLKGLFN